jgi:SAM-dependent methyltransferase
MMSQILCPICNQPVKTGVASCTCAKGHEFAIINSSIIDFLPNIDDETIKEEEKHWDDFATKGTTTVPNSYIKSKIFDDYNTLFHRCIVNEWPDYSQKNVSIVEIGCGPGSALRFLSGINFAGVDYVGIDVSVQSMLTSKDLYKGLTPNWKVRYVRASANTGLFKDSTLDLVFSASALHHLRVNDVIKWVSKSLKSGGLFIMHEPTETNPFARLGRRMVKDFHTKGEKPLDPKKIRKIANDNNLDLIYEKGLHFLSGPMMYCVEMLHFPVSLTTFTYRITSVIDRIVISPSWNYSFIQVYRRK